MMRHRRTISAVSGALLAALLTGCASAPLPPARDLSQNDAKRLAGSWEWSEPSVSPTRLGPGPVKIRIAGGQMLFETSVTSGALTLYEDAQRRILKGEARDKGGGRPFPVTLFQRARGSDPTAAAPGPLLVLVIAE